MARYLICLLPRFYSMLTAQHINYECLAPSLACPAVGLANNLTLVQEGNRPYRYDGSGSGAYTRRCKCVERVYDMFRLGNWSTWCEVVFHPEHVK